MWRLVLTGTVLSLLAGCWSVELSIVVALCAGVVCVMSDAVQGEQASRHTSKGTPSDTSGDALAARRAVASRSARMAANVEEAPKGRRRPVVREATVQRVPLQPMLAELPTEDVLDACVVAQQRLRSHQPDAHAYHTKALPNAIRAAARELTTADPAIVPLDGAETCVRPLGHV